MGDAKSDLLHCAQDRRRRRRPAGCQLTVWLNGHALCGRGLSQHVQHDRRATQMGHMMFRDELEDHCRIDLPQADLVPPTATTAQG